MPDKPPILDYFTPPSRPPIARVRFGVVSFCLSAVAVSASLGTFPAAEHYFISSVQSNCINVIGEYVVPVAIIVGLIAFLQRRGRLWACAGIALAAAEYLLAPQLIFA